MQPEQALLALGAEKLRVLIVVVVATHVDNARLDLVAMHIHMRAT